MKLLFVGTVLFIHSLSFACSPSYLDERDIEQKIEEVFDGVISDLRYLRFRETRYWGGETRHDCPRFQINGKAKVKFVVDGKKVCTLTAKEKHWGNYRHNIKFKNIRCRKLK